MGEAATAVTQVVAHPTVVLPARATGGSADPGGQRAAAAVAATRVRGADLAAVITPRRRAASPARLTTGDQAGTGIVMPVAVPTGTREAPAAAMTVAGTPVAAITAARTTEAAMTVVRQAEEGHQAPSSAVTAPEAAAETASVAMDPTAAPPRGRATAPLGPGRPETGQEAMGHRAATGTPEATARAVPLTVVASVTADSATAGHAMVASAMVASATVASATVVSAAGRQAGIVRTGARLAGLAVLTADSGAGTGQRVARSVAVPVVPTAGSVAGTVRRVRAVRGATSAVAPIAAMTVGQAAIAVSAATQAATVTTAGRSAAVTVRAVRVLATARTAAMAGSVTVMTIAVVRATTGASPGPGATAAHRTDHPARRTVAPVARSVRTGRRAVTASAGPCPTGSAARSPMKGSQRRTGRGARAGQRTGGHPSARALQVARAVGQAGRTSRAGTAHGQGLAPTGTVRTETVLSGVATTVAAARSTRQGSRKASPRTSSPAR